MILNYRARFAETLKDLECVNAVTLAPRAQQLAADFVMGSARALEDRGHSPRKGGSCESAANCDEGRRLHRQIFGAWLRRSTGQKDRTDARISGDPRAEEIVDMDDAHGTAVLHHE
jgi:hypothetical protein